MRSQLLKLNWLIILISHFVFSQQIAEFEDIKERYEDDKLVELEKLTHIVIEVEGDQLKIGRTSSSSTLYLNENAKQYAKESVSYSSFIRLNDIKASTQYVEDGKYSSVKINEFLKKNELDGSFHDDINTLNFIYPKMGPGSITKLETNESILNPRFLGSFYFGGYYPIIYSKLEIKVDNKVNLTFKPFNIEGLNIIFKEEKKKHHTIYTWVSENINGYEMENGTPNYKNYYPHLFPVIEGYYNEQDAYINISSNVKDLYSWYSSLTKGLRTNSGNQEIANLVSSLTAGISLEKEKVRAIYYWVQNNIKYIAYEYALGGFIPREASTVFNRKFGDCKDNSNLLYEMLHLAGIESSLTWIGTRSIPYSYSELPTPAVDNHMILAYQNEQETYYLDATGRFLPLEYPSAFIQGKEALVGISQEEFKINEIPVMPPQKNRETISSAIEIEGTSIKGHSVKTLSGYPKMDVFYALENLEGETAHDQFFKQNLEFGSNKFSYQNLKETNKYDYDNDYEMAYDFLVEDLVTKTSDELMVNLNLDKRLLQQVISKERKTDLEKEYQHSVLFKNTLQIPEGYSIDYLPEKLNIKSDYIDVTIDYEIKGDLIIYTHEIALKNLIIDKEKFSKYNKTIKKVESAYKELTVLKKI